MRVVNYLGFTVLSIFIQFCVMDFIQEKKGMDESLNITDQIVKEPHALYYRSQMSKAVKKSPTSLNTHSERIYSNISLPASSLGTTDISTTVYDILYDENTSVTEATTTTETVFTTTEFDNVTEISFFDNTKKNKSTISPPAVPKIHFNKNCGCNLLYKVCDINCCCDLDCSGDELKYFQCQSKKNVDRSTDGCVAYLFNRDPYQSSGVLDSWLCVVKTNLPDKRNIQKPNLAHVNQYTWKYMQQRQALYEFKKTIYKQADPVWLLKNGTIYYLDFPTPMINNYCSGRASITFLKEESIKCMVKLKDLEMFRISKAPEESMVISATENTLNSSTLNCSTLHCINWTIIVCNNDICNKYNQSYERSCTNITCINVALKIDYHFYYRDSKIINATILLHIQNISAMVPFVWQEINVKFIMTNTSTEVIRLSGSPGYITGLPVIVSYRKNNFTEYFFNRTIEMINNTEMNHYLIYPENKQGVCVLSVNATQYNIIKFGLSKQRKCRYVLTYPVLTQNNTSLCNKIQDDIDRLLGLNKEIFISPLGNPYSVKDSDWIKLQSETNKKDPVFGDYSGAVPKLHCYNLVNRVSFVFIHDNVDDTDFKGQNRMMLANRQVSAMNASFNLEDISIVLTIDINFIDATKPNYYSYAGSPHLNINLPKDFFFPLPSNNDKPISKSSTVIIFCCVILYFVNKITFE